MSRMIRNLQIAQMSAALQFGQKNPDRGQFDRRDDVADEDGNRSPITGKKLPSSAREAKDEQKGGMMDAENRADQARR